ncbi:unnamed protein product [Medioppia subpectinata]|uniref:RecA family profile 1 domain-containing protein n=1 Tax=Medioppia subpectinata TaxID=1979941 RepID=A0A7R9KBW0_9ACAR|nr:unnamed protein product [Medioppia subpectinata]CAG2100521.1 unnamed protein product [Medioppia subpectinata]
MDQMNSVFSRRLLSSFNISDELINKLFAKGLTLKSQIQWLSDSKLRSMCGLSESEMDVINKVVRHSHKTAINAMTIQEMLRTRYPPLKSPSFSLDRALGGGLQVSQITQFCGEGGVGKTQICMQYCINVQLPQRMGGLSGQALYIDTEANLRPQRLASMAQFYLNCDQQLRETHSVESMQSAVHVFTCNTTAKDLVELIVTRVEPFIEHNPQIRLVVVDSIAHLFRYDYNGSNDQKDYELCQIGHKLKQIAHTKKVAVVIANQVSFSFKENKNVPSLGRIWQAFCSTSFMIRRMSIDSTRIGSTIKSVNFDNSRKFYVKLTENGVQEALSLPGYD